MKDKAFAIAVLAGLIFGLMLGAFVTHAQGPMSPGLVTPNYVGIPSSQPGSVTFQAVPVPVDVQVNVRENWLLMVDLVNLNSPQVDAVLAAHNVKVTDSIGTPIFPRPQ